VSDSISTQIDISRDSIKEQVSTYLKEYLEIENVDLSNSSFLSFLVNILSTLTGNILFYQLSGYKEFFLTQAQLPESISNLSAFLGYHSNMAEYATTNVVMTVEFNFPDDSNTFTIPSGFKFKSNSIEFVTYYTSDVEVTSNSEVNILITEGDKKYYLPVTIGSGTFSFALPVRQYKTNTQEFQIDLDIEPYQFLTIDVPLSGKATSINVTISEPGNAATILWTEYNSLYFLDQTTKGYVVRNTSFGKRLFFGNGLIGSQPSAGSNITIVINETEGTIGNIDADSITSGDKVYTFIETGTNQAVKYTMTNPVSATCGKDEESDEEVRSNSIKHITSLGNLVTNNDYKNIDVVVDNSPLSENILAVLKRSDIKLNDIQLYSPIEFSSEITPTRNTYYTDRTDSGIVSRGTIVTTDNVDYYTLFDLILDYTTLIAKYKYVMYEIEQIPSLIITHTNYGLYVINLVVSKSASKAVFKLYYTSTESNFENCTCEMQIVSNETSYNMVNDSTSQTFIYEIDPYTTIPDDKQKYYFSISNPSSTLVSKYSTSFTFVKDCSKFMLSTFEYTDPYIPVESFDPVSVSPFYTWVIEEDTYSKTDPHLDHNIIFNSITGKVEIVYIDDNVNEGSYHISGNKDSFTAGDYRCSNMQYQSKIMLDDFGNIYYVGWSGTGYLGIKGNGYGSYSADAYDLAPGYKIHNSVGDRYSYRGFDVITGLNEGDIHAVFYGYNSTLMINYGTYYTTNVTGSWVTKFISDKFSYVPKIKIDSLGNLYIVLPNTTTNAYTTVIESLGTWESTNYSAIVNSSISMVGIDFDSSNNLHMVGFHSSINSLIYATNVTGEWVSQTITQIDPLNNTSEWTGSYKQISFKIGRNRTVYILHYYTSLSTTAAKMVMSNNVSGQFISSIVDQENETGRTYTDSGVQMDLYINNIHAVYCKYNPGSTVIYSSLVYGVFGESGYVSLTDTNYWAPDSTICSFDSTSNTWVSEDTYSPKGISLTPINNWQTEFRPTKAIVDYTTDVYGNETIIKDSNGSTIGSYSEVAPVLPSDITSIEYSLPHDYAWISNTSNLDPVITKIDLTTNIATLLDVGPEPAHNYFDGEWFWVSHINEYFARLYKRYVSGGSAGSKDFGDWTNPAYMVSDGTYLWLSFYSTSTTTRIAKIDGTLAPGSWIVDSIDDPDIQSTVVSPIFNRTDIWASIGFSWDNPGTLVKINTTTCSVTSTYSDGPTIKNAITGLIFDGEYLWFSCSTSSSLNDAWISKFDINTGTVINSVNIYSGYTLEYDGTYMYVNGFLTNTITVINAETFSIVNTILLSDTSGSGSSSLSFDGESILLACGDGFYRVNIETYDVSGKLTLGGYKSTFITTNAIPIIMEPNCATIDNNQLISMRVLALPFYSIYYTLDGTTPTNQSNLYTVPFSLPNNSTTTVKTVAIHPGRKTSKVKTIDYTTGGGEMGHIWTVNRISNTLSKVNTITNTTVQTIPVKSNASKIVYDGTYLWVSNTSTDSVLKIDPIYGHVLYQIDVQNTPQYMVYDNGYLWVSNIDSHSISKIDTTSNIVVVNIPLPNIFPQRGLVLDDNNGLWTADSSNDQLLRVDIITHAVTTVAVGTYPYGVFFLDGYIWTGDVHQMAVNTVSKVDPITQTRVAQIMVGDEPVGMTFDGTYIWVANYYDQNVSKIEASTNTVVNTIAVGTSNPHNMLFDGTFVWVVCLGGSVCKIDPLTDNVTEISLTTSAYNIIMDGTYIYIGHYGIENKLTKIHRIYSRIWS